MLLFRIPNTISPSPIAESAAPTEIELRRFLAAWEPLHVSLAMRIAITTTASPMNTYRQLKFVVTQPPISGPAAIAAPAAPPIIPYAMLDPCPRSSRHERGDRRDDEHRAETLDQRPAEEQHRRLGLIEVISDPVRTPRDPGANVRSRPQMSPSFAPTSMNAAITSV